MGTQPSSTAESGTQENAQKPGLAKVILWTLLFQLAWHFRKLPAFLSEGNYLGSDDFLRLHQLRNWMNGHGWFDVSVPRMNPPMGAEMHWSRLVDVPISALIWFFDLFFATETAERLAAIAWPTLLLCVTVLTLLAVCEKIYPKTNRLLALLFTVTCITALSEFAPGRIDHHNVQIFLYSLTLLGLVNSDRPWGYWLVGFCIPLSLVVGLDVLLLLILVLAWIGIEWALGLDEQGDGLKRTGASLAITSLVLYPVTIAPQDWWSAHCDAYSGFYLVALCLVASGFLLLGSLSQKLTTENGGAAIVSRLMAGGVAGGIIVAVLLTLFPQCASGPMAEISPELKAEWLDKILEAKGIVSFATEIDYGWLGVPAYVLMLIIAGAMILKNGVAERRFVVIWAAVVITFLLGFIQMRAFRVGIFSVVPICVIMTQLAWGYFSQRYNGQRIIAGAATALVCILLMAPTWLIVSQGIAAMFKPEGENVFREKDLPKWANELAGRNCTFQSQYAVLNAQPEGLVFNDIDIGPVVLVFTQHSVIGGNYHRNGDAILEIARFFRSDAASAAKIVKTRNVDYVAFCRPLPELTSGKADASRFDAQILNGILPDWLEQISPDDERLFVGRVISSNL